MVALLVGASIYLHLHSKQTIETIWGESYDCEEALVTIMNTGVMQRLKGIDQSGPPRYVGPRLPVFSRFDHSVGVLVLLKKAKALFKEQVAGLLHDSSHTVFSHVGDYIFAKDINDNVKESYQDKNHLSHLQKAGIEAVLTKFGMSFNDLDLENAGYVRLEQPLPNMCADRIQYNIHTGVILRLISKDDAAAIVSDLKFEDGDWYFSRKDLAKKFADVSLYCTQNFWGAKWNTSMNIHFSAALRRALAIGLIRMEDLFATDDVVMAKLVKTDDGIVNTNLKQCEKYNEKIPGRKYDVKKFTPKFRGIDPWVKNAKSGKLERLTALDPMFESQYHAVKKWCSDGFEVAILAS
jgi:HD superfamily phosphohydrolase